jgi:hypothetical protein
MTVEFKMGRDMKMGRELETEK